MFRKASEDTFHVLLLEHMMPGMDGIETLKAIKDETLAPDMPVIALIPVKKGTSMESVLSYQDTTNNVLIKRSKNK